MYYEEARGLQGEICVLTGACRSLFGTFQALVQAAKLQRHSFRQDCPTSIHREVRGGVREGLTNCWGGTACRGMVCS